MSQVTSTSVPNGSGLEVRQGINAVLAALASCSSGGTAPANPQAGQLWFDTAASQLKQRDSANAAWLVLVFAGRKISADGPGLSGFGDLSADRTAVLNLGALPDKTAAEYVGPHFVVTNGAVAKSQAKMTVAEAKKALSLGPLAIMAPSGTPDASKTLWGDGSWRLGRGMSARVALTAGSAYDLLGLPSECSSIDVTFHSVKLTAVQPVVIQFLLEDGVLVNAGYVGGFSVSIGTNRVDTGFHTIGMTTPYVGVHGLSGTITVRNVPGSMEWAFSGTVSVASGHTGYTAGAVTLPSKPVGIRLASVSSTFVSGAAFMEFR